MAHSAVLVNMSKNYKTPSVNQNNGMQTLSSLHDEIFRVTMFHSTRYCSFVSPDSLSLLRAFDGRGHF